MVSGYKVLFDSAQILVARRLMLAEQRYFILITADEPADVLMMRQHYQKCSGYGKQAVARLLGIVKDKNDQQRESYARSNGT